MRPIAAGTSGRRKWATTARPWPACSSRGFIRARCRRSMPGCGERNARPARRATGSRLASSAWPYTMWSWRSAAMCSASSWSCLHQSKAWQGPPVTVGHIEIASNQVLVELSCTELHAENLVIALRQLSGWLMAEIVRPGWFERLTPQQRRVLNTALVGLYKTGDVELVSQQILANLQVHGAGSLDFREESVEVHCRDHSESVVVYSLEKSRSEPRILQGRATRTWPELSRRQLLFHEQPVSWNDWVATWEQDAAGPRPSARVIRRVVCRSWSCNLVIILRSRHPRTSSRVRFKEETTCLCREQNQARANNERADQQRRSAYSLSDKILSASLSVKTGKLFLYYACESSTRASRNHRRYDCLSAAEPVLADNAARDPRRWHLNPDPSPQKSRN